MKYLKAIEALAPHTEGEEEEGEEEKEEDGFDADADTDDSVSELFEIEAIRGVRTKDYTGNRTDTLKVEVKWVGYESPTLEPIEEVVESAPDLVMRAVLENMMSESSADTSTASATGGEFAVRFDPRLSKLGFRVKDVVDPTVGANVVLVAGIGKESPALTQDSFKEYMGERLSGFLARCDVGEKPCPGLMISRVAGEVPKDTHDVRRAILRKREEGAGSMVEITLSPYKTNEAETKETIEAGKAAPAATKDKAKAPTAAPDAAPKTKKKAASLAQDRIIPLTHDDEMTAHSSDRLTEQHAKRLAHAAVVKATGGESIPVVIDASTSASKFHLDPTTLESLNKWHSDFVTKDDPKTTGNKHSKLVKSDDLAELWDILGPVYEKSGFLLYTANCILYADGEVSLIYPHLDAHHHFKERVTIVLELTSTSNEEEALHFLMPDGKEMRMPQGEQLLSVSTSGAMMTHYAYVSGKYGPRRVLALFLYLSEFEKELEAGERTEPHYFPSGPLQAVHDAHVEVILNDEPMKDLETGSGSVLELIRAAAKNDDDGSAKAAVPSSSATQPLPQPSGAEAQPLYDDVQSCPNKCSQQKSIFFPPRLSQNKISPEMLWQCLSRP
ncbi:hypothetical protein TrRE_jg2642 [Triparma retinervis]|uniref:Uncharacterized protein n=1 Tax=Triparma retinervis TaxID=2557542 RepID=A0A9W6Z4V3_9STRA|nr:hypothetical protein TrRE_jg2642 [Triparma retinervis]